MTTAMSDAARRAANRAKREIMARVSPVRSLVDRTHEARLRNHRSQLPELESTDRELVDRLGADGTVVTSLDELALPATDLLRAGLEPLVAELAAAVDDGTSTVRPSHDRLLADPEVWRWGLQSRLLDIVENHIGLPLRYYGADIRLERANGRCTDVRQWHRDVEDRRMFKILVWLNDVDAEGGPFECISRERTVTASKALRYVSGFVSDEAMTAVVPRSEWRACTGPAGTAVVTDTARVFHRAMPAVARDRYSVTFTWSSRHPVKSYPAEPMSSEQVAQIQAGLSSRQIACLPVEIGGSAT